MTDMNRLEEQLERAVWSVFMEDPRIAPNIVMRTLMRVQDYMENGGQGTITRAPAVSDERRSG